MNSPADEDVETLRDAAEFIRDHWGIAGDGTNQDPDTETAASICTRLDRAARVAVVRPTDTELRQELARTVANTANRNVEQLSDGESYAVADGIISAGFFDATTNLLAEPASAVVRPTRMDLARVIHNARYGKLASDFDIVDALIREGFVAVSDSQETP